MSYSGSALLFTKHCPDAREGHGQLTHDKRGLEV